MPLGGMRKRRNARQFVVATSPKRGPPRPVACTADGRLKSLLRTEFLSRRAPNDRQLHGSLPVLQASFHLAVEILMRTQILFQHIASGGGDYLRGSQRGQIRVGEAKEGVRVFVAVAIN